MTDISTLPSVSDINAKWSATKPDSSGLTNDQIFNTPPTTYSRLPESTKTTPPPVAPTITPSGGGADYAFTYGPNGEKIWQDSKGNKTGNITPKDESTIRNDEISKQEGRFSAINDLYNKRIADMSRTEGELGAKDLARTNAITAMTGGAGGADAESRAASTEKYTKDVIQQKTDLLNAQRMAEITGIYDKIDANVIAEKNAQAARTAAERTAAVDKISKDAQSNIMAFASNGITWEKAMQDPTVKSELSRTGKTAFEMQKLYNDALPNNLKPKEIFSGFKGNNFVTINQNSDGTVSTHTYSAKELGIPSTVSDLGTVNINNKVYWYDKSKPLKADGTPNLIELGNKDTTTMNPTNADIQGALTALRADPDYTPELEQLFLNDPVKQAKVIEAWKSTKSM